MWKFCVTKTSTKRQIKNKNSTGEGALIPATELEVGKAADTLGEGKASPHAVPPGERRATEGKKAQRTARPREK